MGLTHNDEPRFHNELTFVQCVLVCCRFWTSDDVSELVEAVKKYGRRHWKDIAADTSLSLGRKFTTLELRDKFRSVGKRH